jgi:hypothetical protein
MKKIQEFHKDYVVKDFVVLLNFGVFKSPLKYIWFHLYVIEVWVKHKCCSLKIFTCITFMDKFTSMDIDGKVPMFY